MTITSFEQNSRKAKAIRAAATAAAVLAVFLGIYLFVAAGDLRLVLLYFLVLVGLYLSSSWLYAGVVYGIAGLTLLALDCCGRWPAMTAGLAAMLVVGAAVPFYYEKLSRKSRVGYRRTSTALKQMISDLENELAVTEKQRKSHEDEIDKINKLYLLGRELVERVELEEVLEHLQRILLNRPGVSNVGVFSWEKNDWKLLSCSDQELRDKLLGYIKAQKHLKVEKDIRQLPPPDFLPGKALVFWPVRLEKDLMAGVLIIAEGEDAGRYVQEGEIFIPQIALGLKRTRLFAEVRERSRVDGLTGLYLRRYFLERLQTEIQRAKRYSGSFSLLMLDLDYFKKVNDTYGHVVGDKVLCGISMIFNDLLKPGDLVGRYGGEEFIVLIPMTPKDEIFKLAKEMNRLISGKEFSSDNEKFSVTVSIGISHYPQDGTTVDELIASADHALYWVKTHGRNGIKQYGEIRKIIKKQ